MLLFQELVVFEDLNVFHSQEECVSLDPTQQPTLEKEDSVGEMMLLGKKSSPLCVVFRLNATGKACSSTSSQTFSRRHSHQLSTYSHTFSFCLIPCGRAVGGHFLSILGGIRADQGTSLGKQDLQLMY